MKSEYLLKKMDGKEVLITGGLGFIGSNLAHKLVSLGAKVTLFDAMIPGLGGNMANIKEIEDKVHVVLGDIREYEQTVNAVEGKDYIFNFAAQTNHALSMRDPYSDVSINCKGAITFLEACRTCNKKVKIVYSGTRSQIGEPLNSPINEIHPEFPLDIHSASKSAAEKYHLIYGKRYGMKVTCLRITNTYGPRHQMKHGEYGFFNWWVRKTLLNETIEIWGNGQQTRDLLYVNDVVDACILAAQNDSTNGEVFLLVSGKEWKLIDLAQLTIKVAKQGRYVLKPFPEERKNIYPMKFVGTYDKINKILGWHPKTNLEAGIRKTISFYRERLHDYV